MIADEELAAALAGRDHWRAVEQDAAVYEPPGVAAHVRVGRIRRVPREGPGRHNRYYATLVRDGRALHTPAGGVRRGRREVGRAGLLVVTSPPESEEPPTAGRT